MTQELRDAKDWDALKVQARGAAGLLVFKHSPT